MKAQEMTVYQRNNAEDYIQSCFEAGLNFHVAPHPFFRHAVLLYWIDDEVHSRLSRQFALSLIRKNVINDKVIVESIRDAMLLSGQAA